MRIKKLWSAVLAFWTLLLVLWTAFAWNSRARAAEAGFPNHIPAGGVSRPGQGILQDSGSQEGPDTQSFDCLLDVPFLDQRKEFPTGCESVSAVMALQYWGVEITPDEFIDRYLPRGEAPHWDEDGNYVGCDPRKAFPGDPRTEEGWGCYPPVIETALEQLLREREGPSLSIETLYGQELEGLFENYVNQGVPVLLWATIGMAEPTVSDSFFIEGTGEEFLWRYPMHCLVLVGEDESNYYFNDPMAGKDTAYSKEAVEQAYTGLGRQALVLLPEE